MMKRYSVFCFDFFQTSARENSLICRPNFFPGGCLMTLLSFGIFRSFSFSLCIDRNSRLVENMFLCLFCEVWLVGQL